MQMKKIKSYTAWVIFHVKGPEVNQITLNNNINCRSCVPFHCMYHQGKKDNININTFFIFQYDTYLFDIFTFN